LVLGFWVVAILLAFTPGADWAYAIAAGLRAKSVVPSVAGMVFGYVVVVVVVAVGLGALITRYPVALTGLTVAGSAYLIYLGLSALFNSAAHIEASDREFGDNRVAQFFRGAGVSGINPKGVLLLIALLPQFTTPHGWPSSMQMLALGGLHILDVAVVYFCVAILARRMLRSRPRASMFVTKFAGVVMTLIGAGILVEQAVKLL
jgi:threonine/homoserine/homoserine lactone efflux protein